MNIVVIGCATKGNLGIVQIDAICEIYSMIGECSILLDAGVAVGVPCVWRGDPWAEGSSRRLTG